MSENSTHSGNVKLLQIAAKKHFSNKFVDKPDADLRAWEASPVVEGRQGRWQVARGSPRTR